MIYDFQTRVGRLTKAKRLTLKEWFSNKAKMQILRENPTIREAQIRNNIDVNTLMPSKKIEIKGEAEWTIVKINKIIPFKTFNGRCSNIPEGFDDNGQVR